MPVIVKRPKTRNSALRWTEYMDRYNNKIGEVARVHKMGNLIVASLRGTDTLFDIKWLEDVAPENKLGMSRKLGVIK